MKRLLPALLLTACAPALSGVGVPHLTLSGLTVTLHNPTKVTLTGDVSRNQGPAVAVDGVNIKPAPGASCVPMKVKEGVGWDCSVPNVAPGGKGTLSFVATGPGASITMAQGLGYLGNSVPVPVVLAR